jgi:hypothetical protein
VVLIRAAGGRILDVPAAGPAAGRGQPGNTRG